LLSPTYENPHGFSLFGLYLYIPLIKGEIHGLKIGIDTELNLWEHSRKLNYDEIEGEYLIGIGVGFTKAQQIREILNQKKTDLTFEEKVKLYKYLILKHAKRYGEFKEISDNFVEHLDNWGKAEIPNQIEMEVYQLLNEEKIQRAIDRIYDFNYDEFRLKSIAEFEEIKSLLPELREKKKRGKINSNESEKEKIEIENLLREWIVKRKNTEYNNG